MDMKFSFLFNNGIFLLFYNPQKTSYCIYYLCLLDIKRESFLIKNMIDLIIIHQKNERLFAHEQPLFTLSYQDSVGKMS